MNAFKTASTHPVSHVVFSPDGSTLAVAQSNYGVTLHERATGQMVGTIPVPRVARFTAVIFCDGGRKLAVSSLKGIFLFETDSGRLIGRECGSFHSSVVMAEWSGELLVANSCGLRRVLLQTDPTDPSVHPLRSRPCPVKSVAVVYALSPASRHWGVGCRQRTRPVLLDVDSGRVVAEIDHPHRDGAQERPTFAFAPNGEQLAVCDGNDVTTYYVGDVASGLDDESKLSRPSPVQRVIGAVLAPRPRLLVKPTFRLERPEVDPPTTYWWQPPVAFTPDGRGLLVRRPRNRVQLWDVATGYKAGEWSWRVGGVSCLAVAPDGLTAVLGARFGNVVTWDLE